MRLPSSVPHSHPASARADSALKWDAGSGRPKLSWQHAVALHRPTAFTARALIEWTLTRRIALLSQAPPVGVGERALAQLADDLYAVDQVKAVRTVFKPHFPHVLLSYKAALTCAGVFYDASCEQTNLDAAFARQRQAERRAAADEAGDGADGDEAEGAEGDEADEGAALDAWRLETKRELRRDAEARWAEARRANAPRLERLRAQLVVLKAIDAAGGPSGVDAGAFADDPAVAALFARFADAGDRWPRCAVHVCTLAAPAPAARTGPVAPFSARFQPRDRLRAASSASRCCACRGSATS